MKKLILLFVAAVCTTGLMAQPGQADTKREMTIKTTDGKTVNYKLSDIQEIAFSSLFHSFDGYITATTNYFQDSYFGGVAKLCVWNSAGGYDITLSDPVWGEAEFPGVSMERGQLSGTGTITVSAQYGSGTYAATVSGAMTSPVISIPELMRGGTTLTYHLGEVPQALKVTGNHQGAISVSVGGQTYENPNVTYVITANADGTVNVVVPEFSLENTIMGNLTIGSYTIQNVAYDNEKASFYRDYTGDGLSLHFTAVANGITTMDKDYTFDRMGNITVTAKDGGITIVNNFQPGVMPFPITTTFGTKTAAGD